MARWPLSAGPGPCRSDCGPAAGLACGCAAGLACGCAAGPGCAGTWAAEPGGTVSLNPGTMVISRGAIGLPAGPAAVPSALAGAGDRALLRRQCLITTRTAT